MSLAFEHSTHRVLISAVPPAQEGNEKKNTLPKESSSEKAGLCDCDLREKFVVLLLCCRENILQCLASLPLSFAGKKGKRTPQHPPPLFMSSHLFLLGENFVSFFLFVARLCKGQDVFCLTAEEGYLAILRGKVSERRKRIRRLSKVAAGRLLHCVSVHPSCFESRPLFFFPTPTSTCFSVDD